MSDRLSPGESRDFVEARVRYAEGGYALVYLPVKAGTSLKQDVPAELVVKQRVYLPVKAGTSLKRPKTGSGATPGSFISR